MSPVGRLLRRTGADLPFGDPLGAHPGVALESHFWRFADPRRGTVVLCAATVCRDADGAPWASVVLATERGVVHEAVDGWRAAEDRLDLRVGDGVLTATEDRLEVALPSGDRLGADLRGARAWPRRRHGGLGLAHHVPGLTQYWHPHLLGGPAAGEAHVAGRRVVLDGALAYAEKNWGADTAPPAWWWGQGFVGEEVAFAFAGGELLVGPARPAATAVVVRAGDELAAFSPPFAAVRVRTAPGAWDVEARSATWRLRLRGRAAGDALHLPVPVPAERRTEVRSHQHQHGEVALELRRGRRLVVAGGATLCGLERGGALRTG